MTHARSAIVIKVDGTAKISVIGWARYFFEGTVTSKAVAGGAISNVCVTAIAETTAVGGF